VSRAVLSDDKRRALYDAGMYDPLDDDQEDVEVRSSAIYSPMLACAFGITVDGNLLTLMRCALMVFRDFTTSSRRWSRSWPPWAER